VKKYLIFALALIISFVTLFQVVRDEDLATNTNEADIERGEENNIVILPTSNGYKTRSSECAICLDSYMIDDVIVWSENTSCSHVFHEKCILPWLCLNKDNCCPSCRQDFIPNMNQEESTQVSSHLYNTYNGV